MAETAAAASAVELPEDAIREVLVRVPDAAARFRCAATCTRWRLLVADPFFLGRRWPSHSPGSSFLFGFFAWRRRDTEPVFIEAPLAPLGVGCCSIKLFFPDACASGGLLHRAEPLTSCRGLLLMRLRM
jgi:hypothetical protein